MEQCLLSEQFLLSGSMRQGPLEFQQFLLSTHTPEKQRQRERERKRERKQEKQKQIPQNQKFDAYMPINISAYEFGGF